MYGVLVVWSKSIYITKRFCNPPMLQLLSKGHEQRPPIVTTDWSCLDAVVHMKFFFLQGLELNIINNVSTCLMYSHTHLQRGAWGTLALSTILYLLPRHGNWTIDLGTKHPWSLICFTWKWGAPFPAFEKVNHSYHLGGVTSDQPRDRRDLKQREVRSLKKLAPDLLGGSSQLVSS